VTSRPQCRFSIELQKAASISSIPQTSIRSVAISQPRAVQRRSSVVGCTVGGTASSWPRSASDPPGRHHSIEAIREDISSTQSTLPCADCKPTTSICTSSTGLMQRPPIDETLGALGDLVHRGKIRYIGCSNFLTYQLVRAIGRSETLGLPRFDSVQPRYNLLFRQIEREMLPFCAEEGVGVIPYNPIAGGLLSGKHRLGDPPAEGSRFTLGNAGRMYQGRYWHDKEFDTVDQLRAISEEVGVSLVTLSIAWGLANEAITAPIIGASHPDQLAASLEAAEFVLEDDVKSRLDDLTHEYRMGDAPR
jgi:aryl-alcohol dehydrogenase-like predicted oxidoreductase